MTPTENASYPLPSPTGPTVKRDGNGHILYLHPKRGVWMLLLTEREISTRRGLIRSIQTLTEKAWITTAHIHETITLAKECVAKE